MLGEKLGEGGEGQVYAVQGQPNWAIKLYVKALDFAKTKKLLRMASAATPDVEKVAAWPIDLLIDWRGRPCGFVMPRVQARGAIHELYSPKSRIEVFPEANFRFLIHVATNVARAFAVLHSKGHVLGDVNHGNLLVGTDGTVKLIDCDSIQIGQGASTFFCDVGVPEFTAPELQGQPFQGLRRTANHDRFGLAVLLFYLLFMGRHPFDGVNVDTGPDEQFYKRAIAEYRFAYGPNQAAHGTARPPNTISLETMGTQVADLFLKAFERFDDPGSRPDAAMWIQTLEKLQAKLQICSVKNIHQYSITLDACPWCPIEDNGIRLFGRPSPVIKKVKVPPKQEPLLDLEMCWQRITAIAAPNFPSITHFYQYFLAPEVLVKGMMGNIKYSFLPSVRILKEEIAILDQKFTELVKNYNWLVANSRYERLRRHLVSLKEATQVLQRNDRYYRSKEWKIKRAMYLQDQSVYNFLSNYTDILHKTHSNLYPELNKLGIKNAFDIIPSRLRKLPKQLHRYIGLLLRWRRKIEKQFKLPYYGIDADYDSAKEILLKNSIFQLRDEIVHLKSAACLDERDVADYLREIDQLVNLRASKANALQNLVR